ncbi:hypothetical protein SAMN05421805_111177 [Saccharopolyspora antimicrobica]|uniref:Uncharacterized protein n=1 Tax=Saccharopolyspora antimicrobica TaxID=455193 RepID=A0A1I5FQ23_9PSEU|nr:hypothetical protein [Saccharopolyspora antimicrobica]RKT82259.1 hypothetical protein ATL45_0504 [Saccharopolyspora antimicrobica]SFO25726.1 hypothetical protein SAMN05421805_111177 [Saccharopolyspora antimicrobica]
MDFEQIARDLCTADPAEFIAARDREAAAAKQRGDDDLAAALKKLRKPTTAAWAVNLLAAREPAALGSLLDLGERLRSAQRELRGDDIRGLAGERTEILRDLTDRAAALAGAQGHPLTQAAREQVEQTLTAALSDPAAGQEVQAATLAKPLEYSGFGLDELAVAAMRRTAQRTEKPRRAAEPLAELREELRRSDAQLGEAADALEAAERAQREAEDRCEELRDEIDELREQLAQRRDALEHAEDEQRELRRSAKAARQRRERAQRDRDAAAERLRSAETR